MLDEDQRDVPVEAEQELGEELALAAREPRRRLVEHERLRLGGERHRDRDLAVLAVGERADELAELVRDRDSAGRLARALADRPLAPREQHRAQPAALDADDREVDESSTVSPLKRRDCWYVRASPSFAR